MKRSIYLTLLLAFCLCGLFGCGQDETKQEELKAGEYYLYYTNQTFTKLGVEVYQAETKEPVLLADALLSRMQEAPKNMELLSVIPEEVHVARTQMGDGGQLFVYFNAAYNTMEPIREIMCRAAVVKTLTQIDGVDYVGFYINDQPLMDADNNSINLMSASSFVESSGNNTAELQEVDLTLYFADETGTKLLETERSVVCGNGISMESLVVEQLLSGCEEEGRYATLPKTAKALSVATRKGVCYINFDSAFIGNALNVSDYIPIYSIVNSLTELPNVSRVQISVEGVGNIKFRDSIDLEQPLERRTEYIEGGAAAEEP
ncbi:MAG: GerMN domain-containing protein [Lachnospiraceae bacterium]|jgi:germination protein M|nr:GerMN domain-containing protein [Lachnospiraceae bacterium]